MEELFRDLNDEIIKLSFIRFSESDPKVDWSAAYYFNIILLNGQEIGICDLRIEHTDSTYIGGNIGYEVYDKYQGNKYATRAVKLLIQLAKKSSMKYLIITTQEDNIASRKTCLNSGFILQEKTGIPSDHQMYKEGLREVLIYRKNI